MDMNILASKIQLCYSTTELTQVETSLTMTSREIAELTGVRHDNAKRTLQTLVENGIIVQPQAEDEQFQDSLGRSRTERSYRLDERAALILTARLSPEFTAKLVDQWLEMRSMIRTQQLLIEKQAKEKANREKHELASSIYSIKNFNSVLTDSVRQLKRVNNAWYKKLDMPAYLKHMAALDAIINYFKTPVLFEARYNELAVDFSNAQDTIKELDCFINKNTKNGQFIKLRPETLEILSIKHDKL